MAKFVKISVVGGPALQTPYSEDMEAKVQEMMAYLRNNISKVLPEKPDLILLHEAVDRFPSFNPEQRNAYYRYRGDRIRDMYREIAKENHCYIAYSAIRYLPDEKELPFRNSTQIIGRDGEIVGIYDKNHIVPSEMDTYEVAYGTEAPVFELDFGRVACAICFDINYRELMERYAVQKPDLILYSGMFHGGLLQQQWAYCCRSYFAGAVCDLFGEEVRMLNPLGEVLGHSSKFHTHVTCKINLDYALIHKDQQIYKFNAAKKKYGELLQIKGVTELDNLLIAYEGSDRTIKDVMREFEIISLDDYLNNCRAHRAEHVQP